MNHIRTYTLCTAVAAVLLALLAACAAAPQRTEAQRSRDAQTASAIEQALDIDSRIYARHIDVRVEDGVAHLSGFVWSSHEMYYAKLDAAQVPGVLKVSDELELMRGGRTGGGR
jgi:osmotically-inducible protein OsmY